MSAPGRRAGAAAAVDGAAADGAAADSFDRGVAVLLWLGIVAGVVARCVRYAANRSLWTDEAQLALGVVEHSAAELLGPLDFGQSAPYGFLLLAHASVVALGNHELVLRALPLLASLLALPLFHSVARELLPRRDALVALFLFATSEPLVYYASEFKQYSSDVLVVLAVLRAGLACRAIGSDRLPGRPLAVLAVLGAGSLWLAHPAAFACAAVASLLVFEAWRLRDGRALARLAAIGGVWLASFAGLYFAQLRETLEHPYLREFWADAFAPFPPTRLADLRWYLERAIGFHVDPLGLPPALLAAAASVLGAAGLLRRRAAVLAWIVGPLLAALAASMLDLFPLRTGSGFDLRARIYPFEARLWLFGVPLVLLLIASGLATLRALVGRRGNRVALLALALISAISLRQLGINLADPPEVQEMRPLLARLAREVEPGDQVWVQRGSEPTFEYYAKRDGLRVQARNVGAMQPEQRAELEASLARLEAGQRVWLVALEHPAWDSAENGRRIEALLLGRAQASTSLEEQRAHARLYRVSGADAGADAPSRRTGPPPLSP